MEKAYFGCDNSSTGAFFEGYTLGQLWNGWECPYFSKQVADRICERFGGEDLILQYDDTKDAYLVSYPNDDIDDEYIEGQDYEVYGEIKHLYALGNGEWCWDKFTLEDVQENPTLECYCESNDIEREYDYE